MFKNEETTRINSDEPISIPSALGAVLDEIVIKPLEWIFYDQPNSDFTINQGHKEQSQSTFSIRSSLDALDKYANEQFALYIKNNPHISGPQKLETIYEIDSSNEQGSDYDADEEDNSNSRINDLSDFFGVNESGKLVLNRVANNPNITNSTSGYSISRVIDILIEDQPNENSFNEIDRMLDEALANHSDSDREKLESLGLVKK